MPSDTPPSLQLNGVSLTSETDGNPSSQPTSLAQSRRSSSQNRAGSMAMHQFSDPRRTGLSDFLGRLPDKYHADSPAPSSRKSFQRVTGPMPMPTKTKPGDGTAHTVLENPPPSPNSPARSFMSLFTGPQSTKEFSSEPGRRQGRDGTEGATSA